MKAEEFDQKFDDGQDGLRAMIAGTSPWISR
jgi:hypothetical protein